MRICSEEYIQTFAGFIGYRAQLALYELHTKQSADMPWDDFVTLVQRSPAIREKIQQISLKATINFDTALLDFERPVDTLEYGEDEGEEPLIDASKIFSDELGYGLMEYVFAMFEMEHFHRLADVKQDYSWEAYCNDLSNDKALWNKFARGLQYGLRQIDFSACWNDNATQEELLRLEF